MPAPGSPRLIGQQLPAVRVVRDQAASSGWPNVLELELIRQALQAATTLVQQGTQLATNAIETQTALGEKEFELANDALSKANDLIQLIGRGFAHRSIAGLIVQALQAATSLIQQGTQLATIGAGLSDPALAIAAGAIDVVGLANDLLQNADGGIGKVGLGFTQSAVNAALLALAGVVADIGGNCRSCAPQARQAATGRNTATTVDGGGPTGLPASSVRPQARTSKSQPSQRAEPTRARQHHRPNGPRLIGLLRVVETNVVKHHS